MGDDPNEIPWRLQSLTMKVKRIKAVNLTCFMNTSLHLFSIAYLLLECMYVKNRAGVNCRMKQVFLPGQVRKLLRIGTAPFVSTITSRNPTFSMQTSTQVSPLSFSNVAIMEDKIWDLVNVKLRLLTQFDVCRPLHTAGVGGVDTAGPGEGQIALWEGPGGGSLPTRGQRVGPLPGERASAGATRARRAGQRIWIWKRVQLRRSVTRVQEDALTRRHASLTN